MKKVLIVSLKSCYPLHHGGALAQYYFLDGLKNSVEFVLCTIINTKMELDYLEILKRKIPSLKIYPLDNIIPAEKPSVKLRLKAVARKIFKILFGENIFARKVLYFVIHKKLKVKNLQVSNDDFENPFVYNVDIAHTDRFISLINNVIIEENIKQVQFEFYDNIDLCFAVPKHVHKILILHELRSKRLRLAALNSTFTGYFKDYLISKTEYFEKMCVRQMDKVIVFNKDDANLLIDDKSNILISPFGVPDELIFKDNVNKTFTRFLFMGGERHTPNVLGLLWFLDNIYLPHFDKIKWPIYITGYWSNDITTRYKKHSSIIFLGLVDSIEPYFENAVLVNPILSGSGIRTKILLAFANRVPVLSTKFGAEGCFDKKHEHIGLFGNDQEFLFLFNCEDFQKLAQAGYNYYSEYFNKDLLLARRLSVYHDF